MSESEDKLTNAPAPGTVFAGKYRVDRVLGAGGMGFVVACTHLHLDEPVAMKFLHPSHIGDPDICTRFLREAKAARKIRSEHVVRVLDVGALENGAPYMVMEYLEGRDLDRTLRVHGQQTVSTAVDFILEASEALAEAHVQGMVHRDLKPANLFVTKRADGRPSIKVLDFGISKVTGSDGAALNMTKTNASLGSPLYMAPEQLRSFKNSDGRTDQWALAVILYEMLLNEPPFNAESLFELCTNIMDEPAPHIRAKRPAVPAELDAIVQKCLEKDPAKRYGNVGELALALTPFASEAGRQAATMIAGIFKEAGIAVTPPPTLVNESRVVIEPLSKSQAVVATPNRTVLQAPITQASLHHHPPPPSGLPPSSFAQSQPFPQSQPYPSQPYPSQPFPPSSGNPQPLSRQQPLSNPQPPSAPPPRMTPSPALGATTTGKAWGKDRTSGAPPPSTQASSNRGGMLFAGIGGAVVVVLLIIVAVVYPRMRAHEAAEHEVPSAMPLPASAEPPPVAKLASAEPPPSAVPSAEPVASAAPSASAEPPPVAKPVVVKKVDCSVPYDIDADGKKRWKRECL